jgi:hypothetical protein
LDRRLDGPQSRSGPVVKRKIHSLSRESNPRIRKDNIKLHLKETGFEGVSSIHRIQDRAQKLALLTTVMKLRIP